MEIQRLPDLEQRRMRHAYREFQPRPSLAHCIECYWTIGATPGPGQTAVDLVLPDGCIDILFHLPSDSGPSSVEEPLVVGAVTRAFSVTTAEPTQVVGVRFRPGGASPFVPPPAHELTDGAIPLDTLWGRLSALVWERLALISSEERRVDVLDDALTTMLEQPLGRLDADILRASRRLDELGGLATVEGIAGWVGIGRRQLERRYRDCVGSARSFRAPSPGSVVWFESSTPNRAFS